MIESLERVLERVQEGEIGFSEAGDWLHDNGDEILSELEDLAEVKKLLKQSDSQCRLLEAQKKHYMDMADELEEKVDSLERERYELQNELEQAQGGHI